MLMEGTTENPKWNSNKGNENSIAKERCSTLNKRSKIPPTISLEWESKNYNFNLRNVILKKRNYFLKIASCDRKTASC